MNKEDLKAEIQKSLKHFIGQTNSEITHTNIMNQIKKTIMDECGLVNAHDISVTLGEEEDEDMKAVREVLEEPLEPSCVVSAKIQVQFPVEYITMTYDIDKLSK